MVKKLLVLVVVLVFAANASAAWHMWENGDGDDLFTNANNWSNGIAPTPTVSDQWFFRDTPGELYCKATGTGPIGAKFVYLQIGTIAAPMVFDIIDADFASDGYFYAAYGDAAKASIVNVKNSSVNIKFVPFGAHTGTGTWNVEDSSIECLNYNMTSAATAVATITLDNSSVHAQGVNLGAGTATLTLTNGSHLRGGSNAIPGDLTGIWQTWETAGNLKAGAGETLVYAYDGMYSTVTAVPEPATIALLGLGSMLMIRRKRA